MAVGAGAIAPNMLLSGCAPEEKGLAGLAAPATATQTPTICNMCFWSCAGTVHRQGDTLWKITGNPEDLHSGGRLCTRGTAGVGAYTDPDRLRTPLLRVTRNGKQTFEPVSWDKAFDFIAEKMKMIGDKYGPERMAMFSHGSDGRGFSHLLRAFGTDSLAHPSFAQCRGPRDTAFTLTFGEGVGSPERTDLEHTDCLVLIGSHIGENLHNGQVQGFADAMRRGATVITVDPRFSTAASKSDYWLPIKPGTDIALLLAWINVLMAEKRYDADYVARHTIGFNSLAAYIRPFTPEWAYPETGIEPQVIRETARAMAAAAPATIVHPGRHATWYGDDTQRVRAIAILNALLGSWGRKGGFHKPEKVGLPKFPHPPYPEVKTSWHDMTTTRYPLAGAPVTNVIMDNSEGPDAFYKGWLIYGTNLPLVMPSVEGQLKRAVENLELVVVVDVQPSEVAGYADVILPECSYLERYGVLRDSPERHPSIALRAPAMEPLYDSKPGMWMAKQLAGRLGLDHYFPWEDYTEVIDWQLKQVGSSLDEMKKLGVKTFPRKTPLYMDETKEVRFKTPSGKIEIYSQTLADKGFDPIPRYTPPEKVPDGFYRLNYGRVPAHTFGRTINNPMLFELMPENVVWINSIAATEIGLKSGDYIRLKNQDGVTSNRVRVRVTERIRPDSVYLPHGFGHTAEQLSLARGRGADDSGLMTKVLVDPIMGGTGMRGNFVTLIKETA